MSKFAKSSPALAHSWFLCTVLPIVEKLVPRKENGGGRNSFHRQRKLMWRKLRKLKCKIDRTTSVQKLAKLLNDKADIEVQLKALYKDMDMKSEAKVLRGDEE